MSLISSAADWVMPAPTGTNPGERMNRHGVWSRGWGENISYGESNPRDIVIALIIDDGQRARKHRKNIFNPDFHSQVLPWVHMRVIEAFAASISPLPISKPGPQIASWWRAIRRGAGNHKDRAEKKENSLVQNCMAFFTSRWSRKLPLVNFGTPV